MPTGGHVVVGIPGVGAILTISRQRVGWAPKLPEPLTDHRLVDPEGDRPDGDSRVPLIRCEGEVDGIVGGHLTQVRQHHPQSTPTRPGIQILAGVGVVPCRHTTAVKAGRAAQRESVVGLVVVVHRQADLFEVVDALDASGGLAGGLDGRQQDAIKTAMIAITTNSSMSVKPEREGLRVRISWVESPEREG